MIFKWKRQLKDIKTPQGFIACVQEKERTDEELIIEWVHDCSVNTLTGSQSY